MKKPILILILVLSIALLTSCNSNNIKPDEASDIENPNNGTLVASVSSSRKKGWTHSHRLIDAVFIIKNTKDLEEIGTTDNEKIIHVSGYDGIVLSSHTANFTGLEKEIDKNGRLTVISLPAGEYAVINWNLHVGTGGYTKDIEPKKFKHQIFTIKPNEVTYIGNLHIDTLYGKNIFGITVETGAKPSCSDASTRDIKLLKDNFDALSNSPLSKQIIECSINGV